jgi:quercetin dioxygenase-like cupin family protein
MVEIIEYKEVPRKEVNGMTIITMDLPKAGIMIAQHSHSFDHYTMVAYGSIRVWKNGKLIGDFKAPEGVLIEAYSKHKIMSLEDNTVGYCLHNGNAEIEDENEIDNADIAYLEKLEETI